MNKKSIFVFLSLICVMLISSLASGVSAAGSAVVATDAKNDIIVYAWDASLNRANVKTDQSKPSIDIVSISYGKDNNGNMTIGLTVSGTPVFDNQTFYWVSLDGGNFSAVAWAGAFDNSSNDCSQSCSWFTTSGDSFSFDYSNHSATISGSTVTWTFPRDISVFNSTTYQFESSPVNLPDTANASWSWSALTWYGTSAYSSAQTSGSWWEDSLDSSSGTDTTGDTNSTSSSLPGLDFVSVFGVLTVSATVAALVEKRKKNKNNKI